MREAEGEGDNARSRAALASREVGRGVAPWKLGFKLRPSWARVKGSVEVYPNKLHYTVLFSHLATQSVVYK